MSSSLQAAQARYDTALANFYAQWGTDSKSHSVIPPQDHVWCEVQDAQAQLEAAQKAAKAVNNAYHAFAAETGSTGIDSAHPSASTSLAETQKTRAAAEGLVGLDAINTLSQALESATNITPSNNNSSNSVSSPRNSCFVNVSKDRAIWPKLIPLAFQNCQNEKAVEKKAVQGLAELRFQYFVPLYDLKGEVARLGALR